MQMKNGVKVEKSASSLLHFRACVGFVFHHEELKGQNRFCVLSGKTLPFII
jgi:hypothetical protein